MTEPKIALLMEDNRSALQHMTEQLQALGYEVLTALTLDDAQALLEANKEKIRLVVADMMVPEHDIDAMPIKDAGLWLSKRAMHCNIPVIVASSVPEEAKETLGALIMQPKLRVNPLGKVYLADTIADMEKAGAFDQPQRGR